MVIKSRKSNSKPFNVQILKSKGKSGLPTTMSSSNNDLPYIKLSVKHITLFKILELHVNLEYLSIRIRGAEASEDSRRVQI